MEQNGLITDTEKKSRRKRSPVFILLGVILLLAVTFGAVWYFTGDLRLYIKGEKYLEAASYSEAAEIFEALEDYKDAPARLSQARYGIASELMENKQYLEAAQTFEQAQDYRDSKELMHKCYYSLAMEVCTDEDYELARSYFAAAEDYRDARTQEQRMIYTMGHEAFLKEDYGIAEEYFGQLTTDNTNLGKPHYKTLMDAAEYLTQQNQTLANMVSFHLGEELDGEAYELLHNLFHCNYYYVNYLETEKLVTISGINYYPADRILDAWRKDDTSTLTDEEKQVLDLAEQLVNQAEEETDNDLDKQIWLHDWLCEQVKYESPDMHVKRKEYIELSELNCIGAMLEGKANCQGYTDAFYLLGNMAGFEVSRMFGETGGGHVWNTITLDGKQYIVDVTFDDLSDANYDGWNYTFFNAHWDPEAYTIWGGEKVAAKLARDPHPTKNYFSHTERTFTDVEAAAEDLVSQYFDDGQSWAYVLIENAHIEDDAFTKVIRKYVGKRYGGYISWGQGIEYYGDDTYVFICWKS